jgi:ppGpp synthetase/RelA/SpoT-type nucleotidyltranferase
MSEDSDSSEPFGKEYSRLAPRLNELASEAKFIVDAGLKALPVKIQTVTTRVKSEKSALQKLNSKQLNPDQLSHLTDLVGLRIVALFLTDLEAIIEMVKSKFKILKLQDWVTSSGSEDAFGYMSIHADVQLLDEYAGPRYDELKDFTFEVQIRTILMDAWANVSHFLDYKGPSSIPEELRRDFYALSGLFYVADKHFEIFYSEAERSKELAIETVANKGVDDIPLNLDTLSALLNSRYVDREDDTRSEISVLVEQFSSAGFNTISQVEELLDARTNDLESEEETVTSRPHKKFFTRVGAARISLSAETGIKFTE